MKHLVISTLSLLALGAIATPMAAAAETLSAAVSSVRTAPSAFNLVSHAERGYFAAHGIPGYGQFAAELQQGAIDAEDLINRAIEAGYLTAEVKHDASFVKAVENQLDSVVQASF